MDSVNFDRAGKQPEKNLQQAPGKWAWALKEQSSLGTYIWQTESI